MSDKEDNGAEELEDQRPAPWSRRKQEVGAIAWASFLAACFATMVFFAIFDPAQLGNDDQPIALFANRMTGYAIGFFFFWIVTMSAALLTAYLLDTLPPQNDNDNNAQGSTSAGRQP